MVPIQLRVFTKVMKGQGLAYLTFLERLAAFMISVARRAEAGIKRELEDRVVPATFLVGKR